MTHSSWHAADRPRRPVLFVNPKSGGGKATRAGLAERAPERGIEVIILRRDDNLAALVDEAVAGGVDVLGVAGGDGSLAVVAAAAVAHGLPFVCVPAGTRNHFALDLGIDRGDLIGSLDAFTNGVERRIDVAEVNGRLFLNNVSLGIYGEAVRQPTYRDAKARTLLETAAEVSVRARPQPTSSSRTTAAYASQPVHRARVKQPLRARPAARTRHRPTLDSGRLGVIVLDAPAPAAVRGEHGPRRASR